LDRRNVATVGDRTTIAPVPRPRVVGPIVDDTAVADAIVIPIVDDTAVGDAVISHTAVVATGVDDTAVAGAIVDDAVVSSGSGRIVVTGLVGPRRRRTPVAIAAVVPTVFTQLLHHATALVLADPLLVVLGAVRFLPMLHPQHENLLMLRSGSQPTHVSRRSNPERPRHEDGFTL